MAWLGVGKDRTDSERLKAGPWVRFRLDIKKCVQGMQLLAARRPGITQYYIGKVFFFADRKHLADWGRPISGDRYVAMQHGPVPSTIYDLLKQASGEPDEVVDLLEAHVRTSRDGNRIQVFSLEENPRCESLSRTDREYLLEALDLYGTKPFGELKRLSHEDPAYSEAWDKEGLNNELDLRLWFKDDPDRLAEFYETAPVARRA